MAYCYQPSNISTKQKMNLSTWSMQVTSSINNIIALFASTFLVSFIVQSNSADVSASLISIALYYICLYTVMSILYFALSYAVDKSNRVVFYRLGIVIKGAFIVVLVFLGKDLAKLSAIAGAIYGVAEACYWSSYNVMKGELIPRTHVDKYIALNTLFNKLINVVFPILIGFMIDVSTFMSVALYVLAIVAIQLIFAFLIKSQKPENSSFKFKDYLKKIKQNIPDAVRIKRFYPIAICYGATTICTSLASLLSIYTFKTNLNLGLFTAGFSVLSVICLLLFKKFTKEGHRKVLYIILGVIPFLGALCVSIQVAKWSYIIFYVTETVSLTMLAYALDVQRTTILKKTGHYEDIAEHQTLTEIVYAFSRVTSFLIMLVLGLTLNIVGLRILMIVVGFVFPCLSLFIWRMEKVEKDYPIETRVVCVSEEKAEEN